MNVQQLVLTGTRQAQERWSAVVARIDAVAPRAALERARGEGERLRVVFRQLPTVGKVQGGVSAVVGSAARGLAAVAGFGNGARADAVRAAAELREAALRIIAAAQAPTHELPPSERPRAAG